ncbi:MAG TPA: ADOP family duplicated permease [Acidobacteriota bacterium]|nr:ADOP family duplicated permease [Acidobacteriota bacterium]
MKKDGLFGRLMTLLPRDFREEFGEEIEEIHHRQEEEHNTRLQWPALTAMLRLALTQHLNGLATDFRLAFRRLSARPLFTLAAVFSLGLGTGASVTVFSLIEAVFWRPLPGVERMDRLVNVDWSASGNETTGLISYPNFQDLRSQSRALEDLAGFHGLFLSLRSGERPEVVPAQLVTGNYFSLLGSKPFRGRLINPQDEQGRAPVAVISHRLWTTRFGASEDILGQSVLLNSRPFSIIGIGPPGFQGTFVGFNFDVFLPASHGSIAGLPPLEQRRGGWVETIGRLRPDVPLAQAREDMRRVARSLSESHPEINRGLEISLSSVTGHDEDFRSGLVLFLSFLLAVGLMVLAIACANLANVYLARLLQRRPELALRLALGARRTRLLRLQSCEALLLGLSAAGLGMLLARLAVAQVPSALSVIDPSLSLHIELGPATWAFTLGLAVLATLALGILPTLRADRFRLAESLRRGDQRSAAGSRLHRISVSLQIAFSLMVLITAGLFLRTLQEASAADPGFRTQGVLQVGLNPSLAGVRGEEATQLIQRIREQTVASGHFRKATLTNRVPLGMGARIFSNPAPLIIEGHLPPAQRQDWPIEHSIVSEDYFSTLSIPILRGRSFRDSDGPQSQAVAVVSEAFARRFWPGGDALGRSLRLNREGQEQRRITIVGIAADSKVRSLDAPPSPYLYLPLSQHPRTQMALLAATQRSDGETPALLGQLVQGLAPDLPLRQITPLSRELDRALLPQRLAAAVAGGLGLLGLLLVAVGLYGTAAQSVTARRRELAIRISLGARPRDVLSLILRQSLTAAVAGLVLGLAGASALSHALRGFWTGLSPLDPITFLTIPVLLLMAALISTILPALAVSRSPVSLHRA